MSAGCSTTMSHDGSRRQRPSLVVLDLDGSLPWQEPIRSRLASGTASRLDLRDLGRRLRLWTWDRDYDAFARRLPPRSGAPELFLMGSGDYHHLTAALIARVAEPVTVVHFDNHPDWAWTFPKRHCGSWVNAALTLPQVQGVITIGCCSDDLGRPDRKGDNLAALRSGRLQMHPWYRVPTPLGRDDAPVPGHRVADGQLEWTNLASRDWPSFVSDLLRRIVTPAVWITIDKDVLAPEEAATNWDQGALPLAYLEQAISSLAATHRIVGVDLCGDFSPAGHRNLFKLTEALLDQPWSPPRDLAINAEVNGRLLHLLEAVL